MKITLTAGPPFLHPELDAMTFLSLVPDDTHERHYACNAHFVRVQRRRPTRAVPFINV